MNSPPPGKGGELGTQLRQRIAASGPISVADYMAAANAHYYATRDPLGEAGDFVTAPEISQMFGEIIGAALAAAWVGAGSPREAIYAELGPGRGTLARDSLRVLRRVGFSGKVHLVETSSALRKMQAGSLPDAIFHDRLEDLPPRPLLLVANEFFDALPAEQWIGTNQRKITHDGTKFTFTIDGPVRETSPARDAAAAALAEHLLHHGGTALIIDYGYANGEQGDTFQAVRGHAFTDPLADPGEADLTAHVDFAALASAANACAVSRTITQGSWLESLGIGPRAANLAARNPEQTAAIAAARRRLCDEAKMGQLFKVMSLRHPDWPAMAGFEH